MVERIIRALNREWSGLHEAAFLLGIFALLSQVLGLVRDRMLANQFGAGSELDVYYAAFRIPDFLYASIASFVAVTVLIPFILERISGPGHEERAKYFFHSVFTVFSGAILVVSVIAYVLLPILSGWIVPGFAFGMRQEYIDVSRILLLSPVLLGVSNLLGSITQTYRKFFVFALSPVLYNVGIIIGIIAFLPYFGITGLAWGVVLGAFLHMGIQLPVIIRQGFLPRVIITPDWGAVRSVIVTSFPRTLALSATHFVGIALVAFASRIEAGAIAVFTLAMNLQSIPLSIVGASYSVAAFPTLARLWDEKRSEEFLGQITLAMRHIMFWSFPAISLFIVLRAQIVRSILGSGEFDWTATRLTAAALALFAISIVAQSLLLLFLRSYYAMGETKKPLKYSLIGAVVTIISALLLMKFFESRLTIQFFFETLFRVEHIEGTKVLMLPLSYSLGVLTTSFLIIKDLRRRFPGMFLEVRTALLHTFAVSVIIGFVSYHGLQFFDDFFDLDTFVGIFLQGLSAGLIGVLFGIFLLRLMQNKEIDEIWESLHRRFWRAKPIATEQENL